MLIYSEETTSIEASSSFSRRFAIKPTSSAGPIFMHHVHRHRPPVCSRPSAWIASSRLSTTMFIASVTLPQISDGPAGIISESVDPLTSSTGQELLLTRRRRRTLFTGGASLPRPDMPQPVLYTSAGGVCAHVA